jgi:hypothetical protein
MTTLKTVKKNTTTGKYRSSVRGTHSFIDYFD